MPDRAVPRPRRRPIALRRYNKTNPTSTLIRLSVSQMSQGTSLRELSYLDGQPTLEPLYIPFGLSRIANHNV